MVAFGYALLKGFNVAPAGDRAHERLSGPGYAVHSGGSDTEFAERLRQAKAKVLREYKVESPIPPRWE